MSLEATHPAVLQPLFYDKSSHFYALSPKQLDVEMINVHKACKLNAEWHSRFPIIKWGNVVRNKRSACFQAHDRDIIYAVAIWSSPVAANRLKDGDKMLELRRMAIAEYAPKNTATFMLSKMREWIFSNFEEIETLISYQDVEAHHGTIYKADNWTQASKSKTPEWNNEKRFRAKAQSNSEKIRWEYYKKRKKC